jgi:SurA N-terminal domain
MAGVLRFVRRPSGRVRIVGLLLTSLMAAAVFAQNIPGVAARVNGVEIGNFRLERHFDEFLKGQRRNIGAMINPRVYKKLKREALEQLIERELLWQAAQAEGVSVDDAQVQAALQQMQERMKSHDAYLRKLEAAGFDEKSYAEYLRQDLAGTMYLLHKSSTAPEVSDEEIAAFYRSHLHRFDNQSLAQVEGQIRSRLLAEKRTALAREIVARLKAAARTEILLHLD